MKKVLIEEWLPIQELGIESRRERGAATALPPLSFLHIWWARRPLAASSGVVLAGLLPVWSEELAIKFKVHSEISSEDAYRKWFLHLIGIWGDPIVAQQQKTDALNSGVRLPSNPFSYKMSFKNAVPKSDLNLLNEILVFHWGHVPSVLDPTAGGGSIPFVSAKYLLPTFANDLSGVAASILTAGVEIPAKYGDRLTPHLKHFGGLLVQNVSKRLTSFFPSGEKEKVTNYIWVHAVECPRTRNLIPLMPDKWLRKEKGKEIAIEIITELDGKTLKIPKFKLLFGNDVIETEANRGTVKRGEGISPYDNLVVDGDYIKEQAQSGRLQKLLYAVAISTPGSGRTFRAPTEIDYKAIEQAGSFLEKNSEEWVKANLIPTEVIPEGLKTAEPIRYGINKWSDMFLPRQMLVHITFVEEYKKMIEIVHEEVPELADAILIELSMMQSKALNYNSILSSWSVSTSRTRSVFDRHDFAFKWTFAEFEGANDLFPWALEQLILAYGGLCELLKEGHLSDNVWAPGDVTISQGSAAALSGIPDDSITQLCMDPPYFDNVMYAELADFFYVWEKRTLGSVRPDFFPDSLSDKDDEAVANPSRFNSFGKRRKELAELDYQSKMTAIFAESRRVLKDEGVMSVMFTHKKAEAWDSLGSGLLEAGFTIETSWPVNTEAENSLHQANMNSASSTIMLVCRKRNTRVSSARVYLEDIANEVREAARDAVNRFESNGITGVDLLLSTYGPTLSVISRYWPVYSSKPDVDGKDVYLKPEEALDLAREELVLLRQKRLVGHAARLDQLTDFVVIAWDTFKSREFAFDTARLLALAVGGLDIDTLVRQKIVAKSAGRVSLLRPNERLRRDSDGDSSGIRLGQTHFNYMIDAIDTLVFIAQEDGMAAAKRFLDQTNLLADENFRDACQALVNAIPRTVVQGKWVVPEAGVLDTLITAYLPEVTLPAKEEIQIEAGIPTLFDLPEINNSTLVD